MNSITFLTIPNKCPVCGGNTEIKIFNNSEILYCCNPQCLGQTLNKLDHFCGKKGLNIIGLSKATLKKLIDWGWVSNFKDILALKEHKEEWIKQPGFDIKSVTKILLNIQTATHPAYLWRLLSAAGIPQIGTTAAKTLATYFQNYADFRSAIEEDFDFCKLPDFGNVTKQAILNFDYIDIDNAVFYGIDIKNPTFGHQDIESMPLVNVKVCITGKLQLFKNRDELKDFIKSYGGTTTENVINATVLINNNINSTSTKNKLAKTNNIIILTEKDFLTQYNINL